jgi:hypothetical protein
VRAFLAQSLLRPDKVYFRGDPGFLKSRGPSKTSGFNLSLSPSELGASSLKQCTSAVAFLRRHRSEFLRMRKLGLTRGTLDFGLYDLATEKRPWPSYPISRQLTALAGEFGFDIVLSFYGPK